jgi:hypothetical protein
MLGTLLTYYITIHPNIRKIMNLVDFSMLRGKDELVLSTANLTSNETCTVCNTMLILATSIPQRDH